MYTIQFETFFINYVFQCLNFFLSKKVLFPSKYDFEGKSFIFLNYEHLTVEFNFASYLLNYEI